jgi:DNA transformation protein
MSVSDDFLRYVIEQISAVRGLRRKRMFGAVGLYSDEHFFAVVDDDVLYLKTDASNRADYEARGMRQFMPGPAKAGGGMAYHEVPADVLEDRDELLVWARKSVAVGAASTARKVVKAARKSPGKQPAKKSSRRRSSAARRGTPRV